MRTLLVALLTLALAAGAEAQTAPAKKNPAVKKTTTKTKPATRRPARRAAVRPTARPADAPTTTENTNIAPPPDAPGSKGGQGSYAALGMPINPSSGKDVGGYNSSKPTSKPGSTLGSGK